MQVNFYSTLRQIVGCKTVEFPVSQQVTVQELVEAIVARYPLLRHELLNEEGRLFGHVHVFVSGRDAHVLDDGIATKIGSEDTVNIFPAVGGG